MLCSVCRFANWTVDDDEFVRPSDIWTARREDPDRVQVVDIFDPHALTRMKWSDAEVLVLLTCVRVFVRACVRTYIILVCTDPERTDARTQGHTHGGLPGNTKRRMEFHALCGRVCVFVRVRVRACACVRVCVRVRSGTTPSTAFRSATRQHRWKIWLVRRGCCKYLATMCQVDKLLAGLLLLFMCPFRGAAAALLVVWVGWWCEVVSSLQCGRAFASFSPTLPPT